MGPAKSTRPTAPRRRECPHGHPQRRENACQKSIVPTRQQTQQQQGQGRENPDYEEEQTLPQTLPEINAVGARNQGRRGDVHTTCGYHTYLDTIEEVPCPFSLMLPPCYQRMVQAPRKSRSDPLWPGAFSEAWPCRRTPPHRRVSPHPKLTKENARRGTTAPSPVASFFSFCFVLPLFDFDFLASRRCLL